MVVPLHLVSLHCNLTHLCRFMSLSLSLSVSLSYFHLSSFPPFHVLSHPPVRAGWWKRTIFRGQDRGRAIPHWGAWVKFLESTGSEFSIGHGSPGRATSYVSQSDELCVAFTTHCICCRAWAHLSCRWRTRPSLLLTQASSFCRGLFVARAF